MKTSYVDKNSSNNRTLTKVVVDAYVYVCGRGGVLRFYAWLINNLLNLDLFLISWDRQFETRVQIAKISRLN